MNLENSIGTVKSALFVDFDNIYISLSNIDKDAAEKFATDPAGWLGWFERGMPSEETAEGTMPFARKLLLRRCYLNPVSFGNYRAYFTRSAFSVIDCPPLTQQGKNSTDIHMVMDILDTLKHETHFDEFIILSGDADFTPVLLRLRVHNRLTVILTAGPVAQPYRAASDRVISGDDFIEDGLGVLPERLTRDLQGPPVKPSNLEDKILDAISQRVYEQLVEGDLLAINLPPILKEFPQFRASTNWLGFYSLRDLTAELTRRKPEMLLVEGDPSWKLRLGPTQQQQTVSPVSEPSQLSVPTYARIDELANKILTVVNGLVADSKQPVHMGYAGNHVIRIVGPDVLQTHWAGAGSFTGLLRSVKELGFEVITVPGQPGYLYDPTRHKRPDVPAQGEPVFAINRFQGVPIEIADLARRVSSVTGSPLLTPAEYTLVFRAIEDELKAHPYFLTATSKAVRDRCIERGSPISRKAVNFILLGIVYAGHKFDENPLSDTAEVFSRVFKDNVLTLCKDAQLELSPEEHKQLDQWLNASDQDWTTI